uniref:NADH-ubiquinone oxidoreductase chain 2 n=1 Tax=Capillidium heterosporum TaxID=1167838 RepID=A0A3T0QAM7_9FUNG|nr:NADH dehydrogenase subunit 2 [Capillidium heterosporum]AZZ06721.1 NADH dehydrogenase subunit 2 [Capillidium heterosporum]
MGIGRAININRMTVIVFIYSAILSINMTEIDIINTGVGIYNGLYIVTPMSQYIESYIYIIGGISMVIAKRAKSEYSILIIIITIGMSSIISSNEIISILIGIELQTLGLYVIASINRESERSTAAGIKYYLLGGISSCIIGLGCSMIYGVTGVTNIEELKILININKEINIIVPVVLITVGLLFKIGAAPLHNWLADVIDGVPTIISTWLAVVSKISIIIILYVLYKRIIRKISNRIIILSIILSLIIGSLVGVIQYRIKRLLAYSSIAHAGYILIGIIIDKEVTGLIFYIVQYTITILNIFIIIIAYSEVIDKKRGGEVEYISQLKGIHKRNPLLGISLAISLFSSAGIPPFIGFFGKLNILYGAIDMGNYMITIIAILTSIISCYYYIKVIKVIYFHPININEKTGISENISIIIGIISFVIIFFIISPEDIYNSIQII